MGGHGVAAAHQQRVPDEGVIAHGGDAVRQLRPGQGGTVVEGPVVDGGQRGREVDLSQACAVGEGAGPDGLHRFRQHDALQGGALPEGGLRNGGDIIVQLHVHQGVAVREGGNFQHVDPFGQNQAFRGPDIAIEPEQLPVPAVAEVLLAGGGEGISEGLQGMGGHGVAAAHQQRVPDEGVIAHGGDAVRQLRPGQGGTVVEGPVVDGGQRGREVDLSQACAVGEGASPDGLHRFRQHDALQGEALPEGCLSDSGHRFAEDCVRNPQPGIRSVVGAGKSGNRQGAVGVLRIGEVGDISVPHGPAPGVAVPDRRHGHPIRPVKGVVRDIGQGFRKKNLRQRAFREGPGMDFLHPGGQLNLRKGSVEKGFLFDDPQILRKNRRAGLLCGAGAGEKDARQEQEQDQEQLLSVLHGSRSSYRRVVGGTKEEFCFLKHTINGTLGTVPNVPKSKVERKGLSLSFQRSVPTVPFLEDYRL